jgi:hypothetical protein
VPQLDAIEIPANWEEFQERKSRPRRTKGTTVTDKPAAAAETLSSVLLRAVRLASERRRESKETAAKNVILVEVLSAMIQR